MLFISYFKKLIILKFLRFANIECRGSSYNGTCYKSDECNQLGGVRQELYFIINHPGVDFIKLGGTGQIIEIALSICALRLPRTFTHVKSFQKLGVGCQPGFEIDPHCKEWRH